MNKQMEDYELIEPMKKYVPEMPLRRGWFGDFNWGITYWGSYTACGAALFLIPKLLARIEELENKY